MSAATDLGVVDEQIFSTAVGSDKAKALITVEPFDGSLCHISELSHRADVENTRTQPTRRRVGRPDLRTQRGWQGDHLQMVAEQNRAVAFAKALAMASMAGA